MAYLATGEDSLFGGSSSDSDSPPPQVENRHAPSGRPKKKRRTGISAFLDDEAEADDDEDEYLGNREAERESAELREALALRNARRAGHHEKSVQDIVESIEERHRGSVVPARGYGRRPEVRREPLRQQQHVRRDVRDEVELEDEPQEEYYGEDYVSHIPPQANLPSVTDPKLWCISVTTGKEQQIVVSIMRKCFHRASEGKPLLIKSAIASGTKGFIYIEADREAHIDEALGGIRGVFRYKRSIVPIPEMTSVLTVNQKGNQLKPGSWVRFKRTIYRGDLAQVVEVLPGDKLALRFLPRLDLHCLGIPDPKTRRTEEKQRQQGGNRPAQKLFNPDDLPQVARVRYVWIERLWWQFFLYLTLQFVCASLWV